MSNPSKSNHISMEPLFNEGNDGEFAKVTTVSEVGKATNRAAVSVTDTRQEITIGANQNSIEIYNGGDSDMYYGGSGVTSATGIPIFADQTKTFNKVKADFSVYLICSTAQTATARVVEYE